MTKKITFTFDKVDTKSLNFIYSKKTNFGTMSYYEFVDCIINNDPQFKGVDFHMIFLRKKIIYTLRQLNIFIGSDTVDELIYYSALQSAQTSFIPTLIALIKNNHFHEHALVVFPVHSFGLLGFGLLDFVMKGKGAKISYTCTPAKDISVSAQTGSLEDFISLFKSICRQQRIKAPNNDTIETIRHYYRSRNLKWLGSNPLVVFQFRMSRSGSSLYENEFFIRKFFELNAILVYTYFLYDKSKKLVSKYESHFSSANTNNYETMNLYHYLLFSKNNKNNLKCECVPVHDKKLKIAYTTSLDIEVNSTRPAIKKIIEPFRESLVKIFIAVYSPDSKEDQAKKKKRVMTKLHTALEFYKESFNAIHEYEKIINLNTAFEVMFLDYKGAQNTGTGKEICNRIYKLTHSAKSKKSYSELYYKRNEIIHSGQKNNLEGVDIFVAQMTFIKCFVHLVKKLDALTLYSNEPIKDLF